MNKILILLTLAIIAAIIFFVPPIKGLGDLAKIIFFHVPTAWVSVIAFFAGAFFAAKFLRTFNFAFDKLSERAVRLGFIFVLLSTVSGAIFSKLTWGAYWNWDPRQTTIFVLILIYGAYLTLRAAVSDEKIRAKVSAVYSLLSVLTVPFLVFIIPRMYFSLHPSPVLNSAGRVEMDSIVLAVLIAAVVDATLIFVQLMRREIS
ncbi:MAG: cytochrome c biogenesis protein CcsA [Selenomonadaceae bacterium]|nr:cytochrome c biogenesis protein CcsA [Selenomonadaceae bacterium]MBQ3725480.1 cytochrome c biogenesis protein CcsA [Selenomonadaceae bacterium]MBQ9496764.1 cytochrome c biogenesis protein CcsA [Selenomonadaceae bacterium]